MDMNKLVETHIKIRDARKVLADEYNTEDTKLKEQQERLEGEMLRMLNKVGGDSMKTEHGTFYKQKNIRPMGTDWAAFYDWIKKEDAFDALERRIKKTFVTDYMEENDGAVPPGVTIHSEYVIRVRRT